MLRHKIQSRDHDFGGGVEPSALEKPNATRARFFTGRIPSLPSNDRIGRIDRSVGMFMPIPCVASVEDRDFLAAPIGKVHQVMPHARANRLLGALNRLQYLESIQVAADRDALHPAWIPLLEIEGSFPQHNLHQPANIERRATQGLHASGKFREMVAGRT